MGDKYCCCVAASAQRFRGLAMPTIEHLPDLPGAPSTPGNDVELNNHGRSLYDLLVRPVEIHLRGKTCLGVIPHAELQRVPFQALRSDAGYLIERFAVWYAPSAGPFSTYVIDASARRAGGCWPSAILTWEHGAQSSHMRPRKSRRSRRSSIRVR